MHQRHLGRQCAVWIILLLITPFAASLSLAQDSAPEPAAEEYEPIGNDDCASCHEDNGHGATYGEELSHSIHDGLGCQDCHTEAETMPHEVDPKFAVGCDGCRNCHEEASEQYQSHGRATAKSCEDVPKCVDCHGAHDVLPSNLKASRIHPVRLPETCGTCHEDLDLTTKYDILIDHPIEIYQASVHGKATQGGVYVAATCNDCHSSGGSAHRILAPGHTDSAINHFNIPRTCGQCHKGVEADFWEGIHGKLVKRGETDAPVCTHCHGEHGIISPSDSRSPVSRSRVAQETCAPCHESAVLNEKYGRESGHLTSFIDSYHGLKSKAGDTHVANCASCHGVHRILPSSDPTSTINPAKLQGTCGACHPGISQKLANQPIHGVSGEGLRTTAADIVARIYIIAIVVIIGLMVLHWLIDLIGHLRAMMTSRPQIRRMTLNEVWQHLFLTLTFVLLVISGFALRFSESWMTRLFFGWEGGFEVRGQLHRFAAVLFVFTVAWHLLYVAGNARGRTFVRDMWPTWRDFAQFGRRILHSLGRRKHPPHFGKFSYVEKAEYWALVWGSAIMIVTGLMLWFDNWFIQLLPKGFLDVALVIHYYEAWLATLAIAVWHMYSTVFNPHVYPMNPSWLTGYMPEKMYSHEHPHHVDEAREETAAMLSAELEKISRRDNSTDI